MAYSAVPRPPRLLTGLSRLSYLSFLIALAVRKPQ
jgi:hypothetical protein